MLFAVLTSCDSSIDNSTPEGAIHLYLEAYYDEAYEKQYDLITDTIKTFVSQGDFQTYYEDLREEDYVLDELISIDSISCIIVDPQHPHHKRYEFRKISVTDEGDTVTEWDYVTVEEHGDSWRVVWTGLLRSRVTELYDNMEYGDALNECNRILTFDPFSAKTYSKMGWSYLRLNQLDSAESFAKQAVEHAPRALQAYNLLASVYVEFQLYDLGVVNFEKAIELSPTPTATLWANLGLAHERNGNIQEAMACIDQSIAIDSSKTHSWWTKGLLAENRHRDEFGLGTYYNFIDDMLTWGYCDEAMICFERALRLEPMDDFLQKKLHTQFAGGLMKLHMHGKSYGNLTYEDTKQLGLDHAIAGLALDPHNETYQQLVELLKN